MHKIIAIAALILFILPLRPSQAKEQEYLVTKVIAADTIVLENGNIVHYLGVSVPQPRGKEGGGDFFAREAFRRNKGLVLLKKVRLEFDAQKKDEEGRTLAYVFIKDVFVNGELIRLGFAHAAVSPPNVRYKDLFLKYEREAKEKYTGLWQEGKEESEPYYVGNKRSYVFHKPSCPLVAKIPEKSRIVFRSRVDPIRIGYVPCKKCRP
jgi:micrococcal nuclease